MKSESMQEDVVSGTPVTLMRSAVTTLVCRGRWEFGIMGTRLIHRVGLEALLDWG